MRGGTDGSHLRVAVIVSRWNEFVTTPMLEGALDTLASQGVKDPVVYAVPGTWEIPVVVAELIRRKEVDALVALGCILQGQTTHAQLLAGDVSHALMDLQVQTGVPIAWGILTPDTADQAIDRAGMKMGNKGREAASAAIEMANVLAQKSS